MPRSLNWADLTKTPALNQRPHSATSGERDDVVHRLLGRFKEAPDITRRLPDALFVFHERDADVIVAMLAKADARSDGDRRLLDQQLGELQRTKRTERLRDLDPG